MDPITSPFAAATRTTLHGRPIGSSSRITYTAFENQQIYSHIVRHGLAADTPTDKLNLGLLVESLEWTPALKGGGHHGTDNAATLLTSLKGAVKTRCSKLHMQGLKPNIYKVDAAGVLVSKSYPDSIQHWGKPGWNGNMTITHDTGSGSHPGNPDPGSAISGSGSGPDTDSDSDSDSRSDPRSDPRSDSRSDSRSRSSSENGGHQVPAEDSIIIDDFHDDEFNQYYNTPPPVTPTPTPRTAVPVSVSVPKQHVSSSRSTKTKAAAALKNLNTIHALQSLPPTPWSLPRMAHDGAMEDEDLGANSNTGKTTVARHIKREPASSHRHGSHPGSANVEEKAAPPPPMLLLPSNSDESSSDTQSQSTTPASQSWHREYNTLEEQEQPQSQQARLATINGLITERAACMSDLVLHAEQRQMDEVNRLLRSCNIEPPVEEQHMLAEDDHVVGPLRREQQRVLEAGHLQNEMLLLLSFPGPATAGSNEANIMEDWLHATLVWPCVGVLAL